VKNRISNLIALVLTIVALNAFAVAADSVKTLERSFEKIAEGVYVIRHKDAPDTFPQGNTTVIVGDREVLVVDSCYLPSSAREDIAQIKQWTNKPVRYLVNTHWHFDHTMGNGVYWEAFSPLVIIAHAETAKQITGYNPGWFERFPRRADRLKQILASGKDTNDKPLSEGEKKEYEEAIAGIAPVQAEFKTLVDRAPNLTFETELSINLGNREVEIKFLGRGNTAGDAIVYLPKEKILATGDLIVHPVPYLFSGYPAEFVKTLQNMSRMDFQIVVPGHGRVLRAPDAKNYVSQTQDFVQAVVVKVDEEVHRLGGGSRNLDAVRENVQKNVDVSSWRQKFAGNDKDNQDFFDGAFAGLITSAYAEIWGR
jgi:cyclase